MQSSAVVTLRVAVMLTCLIVAPMAAIFGSSLPKVVTSLLQGKGLPPSSRDAHAVDLRAQGGEAPVFSASVQTPANANAAASRDAAPHWPMGGVTPPAAPQQPPQHQLPPIAPDQPPATLPIGHVNPVSQSAVGPSTVSHAAPGAASASLPTGETSQVMERRLRELGATYYLLEYLGNSSQHYRFYCKMSIAGNPNLTRPFEATDSDPVQAMRHVLEQVQKWRAGSQP
jgi:hypothetical protein